jgi:hypothetical protein
MMIQDLPTSDFRLLTSAYCLLPSAHCPLPPDASSSRQVCFTTRRQLTTSRENILPSRTPHKSWDPFRNPNRLERFDTTSRWWLIGKRIGSVVWDQVHFPTQFVTIKQVRQLARMFDLIVNAIQ